MSYSARRLSDVATEPFAWEPAGAPVAHAAGAASLRPARETVDTQVHLASLERDAFAKGYAQGERAGAEVAVTRAEGMLRRLTQTVEELAALRSETIRRTERQAVQLVLAIAERIILREVTLDRGLLLGMARAALDRLGEYGSATIRLHPDDFAAIGVKALPDGAAVRVQADPAVSRGGCLVQSDFGFMDVSPESQFRELARTLLSDVDSQHAEEEPVHGVVLK